MVVSAESTENGVNSLARGQCLGAAVGEKNAHLCAEAPGKHKKVTVTASPEKSPRNFLRSPTANVSKLRVE